MAVTELAQSQGEAEREGAFLRSLMDVFGHSESGKHWKRRQQLARVRRVSGRAPYVLGLMLDALNARFMSLLASEIGSFVREAGCEIVTITGRERAQQFIEDAVAGVDALMIVPTACGLTDRQASDLCRELRRTRGPLFPIVSLFAELDDTPSVIIDAEAGIRELAQRLIDDGRRRIVYISGPGQREFALRRLAFERCLQSYGITPTVVEGGLSYASGREAVLRALEAEGSEAIQAIVGVNDVVAAAALDEVRARGRDIDVGGFDGLPESIGAFLTVRQPLGAVARAACDMLFAALNGEPCEPRCVLPTSLARPPSSGGCIEDDPALAAATIAALGADHLHSFKESFRDALLDEDESLQHFIETLEHLKKEYLCGHRCTPVELKAALRAATGRFGKIVDMIQVQSPERAERARRLWAIAQRTILEIEQRLRIQERVLADGFREKVEELTARIEDAEGDLGELGPEWLQQIFPDGFFLSGAGIRFLAPHWWALEGRPVFPGLSQRSYVFCPLAHGGIHLGMLAYAQDAVLSHAAMEDMAARVSLALFLRSLREFRRAVFDPERARSSARYRLKLVLAEAKKTLSADVVSFFSENLSDWYQSETDPIAGAVVQSYPKLNDFARFAHYIRDTRDPTLTGDLRSILSVPALQGLRSLVLEPLTWRGIRGYLCIGYRSLTEVAELKSTAVEVANSVAFTLDDASSHVESSRSKPCQERGESVAMSLL